ncbi:hypothetical protein [Streptomyces sp. NPDC001492]
MNAHRGFETECLRAVAELQECGGLVVDADEIPDVIPELADPDWVLADIASRTGLHLPDHPFRDHFFAPNSIAARWHSEEEPHIVGEFALSHIHRLLVEEPPELEDPSLSDAEGDILFELRVIDQEPYSGSGRLTGIRLAEDGGSHELWLYDMSQERLERLDADYGTYLENVLITKGAYGWQYLFADVDFKEPGLGDIASNLTEVLRVFPELFPDHSYAELEQRLEARL